MVEYTHKCIQPMFVDFTDQLIHYALQQQNPEVNERSKEMKLKKASLQKQQYELQVF